MSQSEFIKLLDDYEINIFNTAIFSRITGQELSAWKPVIRGLVRNGILHLLEKGKYCRHNFTDELVIGSFLANEGVISYWSALNYHGLTAQIPNTVFVQTTLNKPLKTVLGVTYKFVLLPKNQIIGSLKSGFGNNTYLITDKEKTIVDCLDRPRYSGEIIDVWRGIAHSTLDQNKLILYCKEINHGATIKRLGYLLELFNVTNTDLFMEFAQHFKVKGYSLFNPMGADEGKYNNQWRLRINVPKEDMFEIINNAY